MISSGGSTMVSTCLIIPIEWLGLNEADTRKFNSILIYWHRRLDIFTQKRQLDAEVIKRGLKQTYRKVFAEDVREKGIYWPFLMTNFYKDATPSLRGLSLGASARNGLKNGKKS